MLLAHWLISADALWCRNAGLFEPLSLFAFGWPIVSVACWHLWLSPLLWLDVVLVIIFVIVLIFVLHIILVILIFNLFFIAVFIVIFVLLFALRLPLVLVIFWNFLCRVINRNLLFFVDINSIWIRINGIRICWYTNWFIISDRIVIAVGGLLGRLIARLRLVITCRCYCRLRLNSWWWWIIIWNWLLISWLRLWVRIRRGLVLLRWRQIARVGIYFLFSISILVIAWHNIFILILFILLLFVIISVLFSQFIPFVFPSLLFDIIIIASVFLCFYLLFAFAAH